MAIEMEKKVINSEWMREMLRGSSRKETTDLPKAEWVQNGKGFKRSVKFKLLPANSKENDIFALVIGTHWNLGPNKDQHITCVEQCSHLKKLGKKCPVCEAKRQLLAMGFKEEDLTSPGKFGPVSIFDPKLTSNVKAVILETDQKDKIWDQSHVSILQQTGSYMARWLVEKYCDSEIPNLTQWNSSHPVNFHRATDNGKWEREIGFVPANFSEQTIEKLKKENEELSLPDVWKMPTDEEFINIEQIVSDMKKEFIEARNTVADAASSSLINDEMPF